jgi:tetratricopeptide (TPR) repeat protein
LDSETGLGTKIPEGTYLSRRLILVIFLSLLIFSVTASTTFPFVTGTIKGKVVDINGQPLPDVKVTLLDTSRGQTYSLETDKKGNYFMLGIPPAEYQLKLEKSGFQVLEGRVSIIPGRESVFDAVLAPEAKQSLKPEWEGQNARATELFKQGRYEEAAALYREILAVHPDLAAIHFNLGNCAFNLGRYEEAVASFKEAVRLKPDFFDAYTNLANAFVRLKRSEEALPILEEATRVYPENAGLHSSLGLLYLNSGQGIKAAESLEKAAAIDPKAPFPFYSLGIAYTQSGDFEKAIASYEKYLALITDVKEIERIKGVIEQLKPLLKK